MGEECGEVAAFIPKTNSEFFWAREGLKQCFALPGFDLLHVLAEARRGKRQR